MRKNAEKQAKSSFTTCRVQCVGGASWGTLLTKGSHGDASLWPKNAGKNRKMRGHEGTLQEKCGKKREKEKGIGKRCEKRENWRKNGRKGQKRRRKVERREKERREGWEIQRAVGLLHDTAITVGIMPTQKMLEKKRTFEQSAHWIVTTNRPKWHLHRPRRQQVLTSVPKFEKYHKNSAKTTI